jgi:hypothetical protein
MGFLGAILSGLIQGFLGLFGMSDAQKLGRAEMTQKQQAATLKEVKEANEIQDKNASASDSDVANRLQQWNRD